MSGIDLRFVIDCAQEGKFEPAKRLCLKVAEFSWFWVRKYNFDRISVSHLFRHDAEVLVSAECYGSILLHASIHRRPDRFNVADKSGNRDL